MRRTQIYIDEKADEQLRQAAAVEGRSAAALIREALDAYLAARGRDWSPDDPILAMAGTVHLPADAAIEHDRDLYPRVSGKRTAGKR